MIEDEKLRRLETLVQAPVIEVLPLRRAKVGIVTTGSEVYYGRIQDAFGPVLRKNLRIWAARFWGRPSPATKCP